MQAKAARREMAQQAEELHQTRTLLLGQTQSSQSAELMAGQLTSTLQTRASEAEEALQSEVHKNEVLSAELSTLSRAVQDREGLLAQAETDLHSLRAVRSPCQLAERVFLACTGNVWQTVPDLLFEYSSKQFAGPPVSLASIHRFSSLPALRCALVMVQMFVGLTLEV